MLPTINTLRIDGFDDLKKSIDGCTVAAKLMVEQKYIDSTDYKTSQSLVSQPPQKSNLQTFNKIISLKYISHIIVLNLFNIIPLTQFPFPLTLNSDEFKIYILQVNVFIT